MPARTHRRTTGAHLPRALAALAAGAAVLAGLPGAAQGAEPIGYEMVSPPDKSGGRVTPGGYPQSTSDGNTVLFLSTAAFAGTQGNLQANSYIARRGRDGWETRGLTLPQVADTDFRNVASKGLTEDATKILGFSDAALAPGATLGAYNYYLQDTRTGELQFVATQTDMSIGMQPYNTEKVPFVTATADGGHIVFQTRTALTPDAIDGQNTIYEFTGGQVRVVNRDQAGVVDPAAGSVGGGFNSATPDNLISADGRRIWFGGDGSSPLYLREDGTTTVPISVSRVAGDPATPRPATFFGASRDGSVAYFRSTRLTSDAPVGSWGSVYRYDRATGALTYIAPRRRADTGDRRLGGARGERRRRVRVLRGRRSGQPRT